MSKIIKDIQFGDNVITLETGEVARQASGSVIARMGDTMVLVTVVGKQEDDGTRDFFPLTVNYQEKMYAAGRIPGGFLKREGRPSEEETLICRLIDRPLRPLFPEGFRNEVQVVATVMSLDPQFSPDIVAMIGASAAIAIAGMPFNGPIGAARVGYKDGIYLLNPSSEAVKDSQLDLVVAGTDKAILMVESEAKELSEEVMLGAVLFGHEMMQSVIKGIKELAAEVGNPKWEWQAPAKNDALIDRIKTMAEANLAEAYLIKDKKARYSKLNEIRTHVMTTLTAENEEQSQQEVNEIISSIEKALVRNRILQGEPRIDGRDRHTVRPIAVRTGVLPRAHGSALFTRGETQAIVAVALGNERDSQLIDAMAGERKDRFMLHYNFPPFSVGETGMMGSPKRREIGHGRLARRGISASLPNFDEYDYTIRVVSEITESNGSSSMASVCGSSLALMDAGVPMKAPVAGIAMGLIKDADRFAVLTDILGDEDHLGDMDFKVAGSAEGVTALQMDIKIDGITKEIMQQALDQALQGRLHILGIMNNELDQPRTELSKHAPQLQTMKIHPDKIRDVIGRGGSTIKSITEETGVNIDINDDGLIKMFAPNLDAAEEAKKRIKLAIADVEVGETYTGKVQRIVDFGAFVNVAPNKDGLVHISEITHARVNDVRDFLKEGEEIDVKVIDVDRQGRIKLSIKALHPEPAKEEAPAVESDAAPAEEVTAEESSSQSSDD